MVRVNASRRSVDARVPTVVDAHVDSLGRQRGVVVDDRRTRLWMSLGKARWYVADLQERHPPLVDEKFFRPVVHGTVGAGGYRAETMRTSPTFDEQSELSFGSESG